MSSTFVGIAVTPPIITPAKLQPGCGGTWLSLDRWAQIIGVNPLHFHQLTSSTLIPNTVCGDVWYQNSWQHSDRVGRDDICMAIQQAEQEIAREAGFNLMPDWTQEERLQYPQPARPELYGWGTNVRGQWQSVEVPRGYVIAGGIKTKTLVQAASGITRSDSDGDGFQETASIVVNVSFTDESELHVYYPGQEAADAWEIRPITVSIVNGVATVTFKIWQVALATALFAIDPQPLDADLADSFETTVDVYRVYNDPSTQVQFIWEPSAYNCCGTCAACTMGAQEGCLHLRDARMGFVVPAPGTWDGVSAFTAANWSYCRAPDQLRLWYLSGYKDPTLARPYAELSDYWAYAIAYFAASKLERPVCGCSNVNQFIEKWRRDAAFTGEQEGGFTITAEQAANRLGTSMGALYAWRRIQQNGVRVHK